MLRPHNNTLDLDEHKDQEREKYKKKILAKPFILMTVSM